MINIINFVINVEIFIEDFQPIVQPVLQGFSIGAFSQNSSLHEILDTLFFS